MYLLVVVMWVTTLLGEEQIQSRSIIFKILFAIIGALMITIPYWLLMVAVVASQVFFLKHQGVLGEHTITLSDEGLTESTKFNSSLLRWIGIERVASTSNYLLVYLNESQAHIIPKRAFANPEAAVEFELRVRKSAAVARAVIPKAT